MEAQPDHKTPLSASEVAAAIDGVLQVPLHRWISLAVTDYSPGKSELRFVAGPNTLNNVGVVHGGLISALLDAAAYVATVPMLNEGENAVTHDASVSIMRPVAADQLVQLHGEVIRRGRSLVFTGSEASADGKLIATARITKSIVTTRP